jgi:hypothetical protein
LLAIADKWIELYECGIHPDQVITVDQCGIETWSARYSQQESRCFSHTLPRARRKINEVILFFVLGTHEKLLSAVKHVFRARSRIYIVSDLYSRRVHKNDRLAHLQILCAHHGYMHDTTHMKEMDIHLLSARRAICWGVYAETSRRADRVLILHPIRQPNNAKDVQINLNKIIMMGTR